MKGLNKMIYPQKLQQLLTQSLLLFVVSGILAQPVLAQKVCRGDDEPEPAAETQRTVELEQFNLQVNIPSNYRTMLRQDGVVEILHPDDYEMIVCLVQGGVGGHGYYAETINVIPRNPNLSLQQQAQNFIRQSMSNGNMKRYEEGDFSGYIHRSMSEYVVTFVGEHPDPDSLLVVGARCDCVVEVEQVTDLLSRMEWMEN